MTPTRAPWWWRACAALLLAAAPAVAEDAAPWLQRVAAQSLRWEAARRDPARSWGVLVNTELLDGNRVKSTRTERFVSVHHHGHAYQRLVEKNGRPLEGEDARDAAREEAAFAEKARKASRDGSPLDEDHLLMDAAFLQRFVFTFLRREGHMDQDTLRFSFKGRGGGGLTPKPTEAVVRRLGGTAWVAGEDGGLVELVASLPEPYGVGLGALKVEVVEVTYTQRQLRGGWWAPDEFRLLLRGRALIRRFDRRMHIRWTYPPEDLLPRPEKQPPPAHDLAAPPAVDGAPSTDGGGTP